MLVHGKDSVETKKRQFQNPKSYVTFSGREYRRGRDMEIIRLAVFERSRGYCEMPLRDTLRTTCQRNIDWETMELHHLKHRGRGGDDSFENLAAVCRRCHSSHHGVPRWTQKA